MSVYEDGLYKPNANKLDIQFNQCKQTEYPFVYNVPSCIPQQAFRHLNAAFQRFFKGQSGFPQFKKKGRSKAVFHLTNTRFSIEDKILTASSFGKVKMSRPLDVMGKIVKGSISERGGKWFLSVTIQAEKPLKTVKPFGASIGVDLGIKHLATLSNGEKFDTPRPLKRYLKKIAYLHRELHRREKGSHNREKTKAKLSRLYYKITCIRQDVLHKLTSYLIERYGVIAIEDLDVQGMLKNHKLAQAITDVGFYEFKRQLVYKAQWYHRKILTVERFFPSSKRCSCCGEVKKELPLSVRAWTCEHCGKNHDRDVNAAKNILAHANMVLV